MNNTVYKLLTKFKHIYYIAISLFKAREVD